MTLLQGLQGDPELGRTAQVRIAGVLHQQGRRADALKLADQLIHSRPSDVDGHVLKARLLLTAPVDVAAASKEADAAVSADRDSPPAQYTLGLAAMARRDYDAADAAFTKTLALNPRAALAKLQLARVRLARGDAAAAQNAAEDAAGARPDDPDATLVLARTLRANGDLDRARRELSARLERAPGAVPMWVELGHVELAAHRPGEARAALDRALAQSPQDVGAQVLAARLDVESGNGAAAEPRLLDIIRANPDRLDAYELLATYYISRGQISDALTKYRVLAARVPEQPGPGTMIGILLDAANDHAGARAQYEAVLAHHPRAGVAANNLAWMLAEDGRFEDALHLAGVAADTLRGRAEPHDTLGWIYLKTDRPRDAFAAFERAISAAPHEPLYAQHAAAAKKALAARER